MRLITLQESFCSWHLLTKETFNYYNLMDWEKNKSQIASNQIKTAKIQLNVINYSTRIILFIVFFDERNL